MRPETVRELLEPLFAEAEARGLWFFSPYQQMWFSPQQLKAHHDNGCFLWGPVNWELRNPSERVQAAQELVDAAQRDLARIKAEVISADVGSLRPVEEQT